MAKSVFRPQFGGFYRLRFPVPNKVIGVENAATDNGADIRAMDDVGGDHQLWSFTEVDPGWFVITDRNAGKVLDVTGKSTNEGVNVQLWKGGGDVNQHWSVSPVEGGYVLRSRKSKQVLDCGPLEGDHVTYVLHWPPIIHTYKDKSVVQQRAVKGRPAQRIALELVHAGTLEPDPTAWYRLVYNFADKAAELSDGGGDNIRLWGQHNGDRQLWRFEAEGGGWYAVRNRKTGKVLTVANGSTSDSANVRQSKWRGNRSQLWKLVPSHAGHVLVNKRSDKAMVVYGASKAAGANIVQFRQNESATQVLTLQRIEADAFLPDPDAWYTLTFAHSGMRLGVRNGWIQENNEIVQLAAAERPYDQWRFTEVAPGWYTATARHSGHVLTVDLQLVQEGARIVQRAADGDRHQHWAFEVSPYGLTLRNRGGGGVVDVAGTTAGTKVHQRAADGGRNQALTVRRVAQDDLRPRPDAWHSLTFAHSGQRLCVERGQHTNGANVFQSTTGAGSHHLQWRFDPVEEGWYTLTARHSHKVLELAGGEDDNGTNIQQWSPHGGHNQQWRFVPTADGWALCNRATHKPIEVVNGSQHHGANVQQGGGSWLKRQSLEIRLYGTQATIDSAVALAVPAKPPAVVGEPDGSSSLGDATGEESTSSDLPENVVALNTVPVPILFAPFDIVVSFSGDITTKVFSGGYMYAGAASLTAPFELSVDPLRVWYKPKADKPEDEFALTFGLPESRSLKTILEDEVLGALSGDTREIVETVLAPFVDLYENATIILANADGRDPELGLYIKGFNVFTSVSAASIPGLKQLHELFPEIGLDSRSLVLGMGTGRGEDAAMWVSGGLILDVELGTPVVVLNSITLRVQGSTSKSEAGAILAMTLKAGGEELELSGGVEVIQTIPEKEGATPTTSANVWAALEANDGAWENPFGLKGLTINSMGLEIGAGPSIGVRGELHIGDGLLGGSVGLRLDKEPDPTKRKDILDIYSEEGVQLPRIIDVLTLGRLDMGQVLDLSLTELRVYAAPNGGKIAGKLYPAGYALSGRLDLWGFNAAVDGTFNDADGGSLRGEVDPIKLKVAGYTFLEITAADGDGGALVDLEFSNTRIGAKLDGRLLLNDGSFVGTLDATLNERGFDGTVTVSQGASAGIHQALELTLERGFFRLYYSPTIEVTINTAGYRAGISVSCAIETIVDAVHFEQRVSFSFAAMGKHYAPGPFEVSVPFKGVDDLAAAFYRYAADVLTEQIEDALASGADEAFQWVRGTITVIAEDVANLFREAGASATAIADGMKKYNGWALDQTLKYIGVGAVEAANILTSVYDWTLEEVGTSLRDTYNLSADATRDVLGQASDVGEEAEEIIKDIIKDLF